MATRFIPDADKPSVAVEISLEKPLPDYDLEAIEHPTPRDVDGVLVSQGFRDLVDDTRGVLLEILNEPEPPVAESSTLTDLDLTPPPEHRLEIAQLTGAICAGDEIYRPGLWIVLEDRRASPRNGLPEPAIDRAKRVVGKLVERMDLA